MSLIRKAVIPVAGWATRWWPASAAVPKALVPLVCPDGLARPVLQLVVEEAVRSGIEHAAVVVSPGGDELLRRHFHRPPAALADVIVNKRGLDAEMGRLADLGERITYITQPSMQGYGDAVACAREWVGGEPFLLMLGDHVYQSGTDRPCARQLLDAFDAVAGPVSGMKVAPEAELALFGTMRGDPVPGRPDLYRVTHRIVEKPDVVTARRELVTPGLPPGHYLCHFGLHAFTPEIFACLDELRRDVGRVGEVEMTAAQELLRGRTPYHALVIRGRRLDTGTPRDYLDALAHWSATRP